MQIETSKSIKQEVEIETPYYSKEERYNTFYKFTEDGVLIVSNTLIAWQGKGWHGEYYAKSIPCTREEVESKFNEVIKNLKTKI